MLKCCRRLPCVPRAAGLVQPVTRQPTHGEAERWNYRRDDDETRCGASARAASRRRPWVVARASAAEFKTQPARSTCALARYGVQGDGRSQAAAVRELREFVRHKVAGAVRRAWLFSPRRATPRPSRVVAAGEALPDLRPRLTRPGAICGHRAVADKQLQGYGPR